MFDVVRYILRDNHIPATFISEIMTIPMIIPFFNIYLYRTYFKVYFRGKKLSFIYTVRSAFDYKMQALERSRSPSSGKRPNDTLIFLFDSIARKSTPTQRPFQ